MYYLFGIGNEYPEISFNEIIRIVILTALFVGLLLVDLKRLFNKTYPNKNNITIQCVSKEKYSYGDFVKIDGVIKEYPRVSKIKVSEVNCLSEYYIVIDIKQYNDIWKYKIKCFNTNMSCKNTQIKKESN